MFAVAICDDNCSFVEYEKGIIHDFFEEKSIRHRIDEYQSGSHLLEKSEYIRDYDLILLDVDRNGLDVAKKIREMSDGYIAFVSAYINYALEGYKVNAVRYILKEEKNFKSSINECISMVYKKRCLESKKKIILECREGCLAIKLSDLVYIESKMHYCYLYIQKHNQMEIYSIKEKLDDLEQRIGNDQFLRVHKSFLVNMGYIICVDRYRISLINEIVLPIAQSKYLDVKRKFIDFNGKW